MNNAPIPYSGRTQTLTDRQASKAFTSDRAGSWVGRREGRKSTEGKQQLVSNYPAERRFLSMQCAKIPLSPKPSSLSIFHFTVAQHPRSISFLPLSCPEQMNNAPIPYSGRMRTRTNRRAPKAFNADTMGHGWGRREGQISTGASNSGILSFRCKG